MIATWMLYATVLGLLVAAAALAADRAVRALRLPARFLWAAAMAATVIVPLVAFAAGRTAPSARSRFGAVSPIVTRLATTAGPASVVARAIAAVETVAERADRPLAILWILLSIVTFARFGRAVARLARDRRRWSERRIAGVTVFVTPDIGPAVIALPRSQIVLPEWALSLDDPQLTTIVRHEREHDLAGDARMIVAAAVMTALAPWNVVLWWQSRRLRLAIEMDCDARVLEIEPRVDRYGALLLAIAQHPRVALQPSAMLSESLSDLERRIQAMTAPRTRRSRSRALVGAGLAAVAVFAACETPAPSAVDAPRGAASLATAPTRHGANDSYFEYQVEKPARVADGNPTPRYPTQLRRANIEGQVIANFVVDTNGTVEMRTFIARKSDHQLFTDAVREALATMRFKPATVGGRPVRQLISMPFVFSLSR